MAIAPLSWQELESLTDYQIDTVNGLTNAKARLRLFGQPEFDVRVTLYRDMFPGARFEFIQMCKEFVCIY